MVQVARYGLPYTALLILLWGFIGCRSDLPALPKPIDDSPVSGKGPTAEDRSLCFNQNESEVCSPCHMDHYILWADGGHSDIPCEECHGNPKDHIQEDIEPRPDMKLPAGADGCLSCHGELESLEAHVEFVGQKHSVKTDVGKAKGRCTFCHDPHSLE